MKPNKLDRLRYFFWSTYYLKPSQIFWRLFRAIKFRFLVLTAPILRPRIDARKKTILVDRDFPEITSRLYCESIDLQHGAYTFLHDQISIGTDATAWRQRLADAPLLWQFHFHYHDYLVAMLQRDPSEEMCEAVARFIEAWIDAFPIDDPRMRGSAYHAYVISIRAEMWIRILSHFFTAHDSLDETRRRRLTEHLFRQYRILLSNIEWGTRANHLLRNIKALLLLELYFLPTTGENSLRSHEALLHRELKEQILDDGCHFERSPMYHVSILSDLLDLIEVSRPNQRESVSLLEASADQMLAFLREVRHPDGDYPFFNDSTTSSILRTDELIERAETLLHTTQDTVHRPEREKHFRLDSVSGIVHHRSDRLFIAFDAGNIGPDYQPGHAHADTLSFELSLDRLRWITDTGVWHYRPSRERTYSRSTAAHNTIELDGEDQSEMWDAFRVARRAKILFRREYERDGCRIMHAAHDGYSRLRRSCIHERAIAILPSSDIVIVDWLHGHSSHRLRSFLHFHPQVRLEKHDRSIISRREGSTQALTIHQLGDAGESAISETEYYPNFGVKQPRLSIVFEAEILTPAMIGFVLQTSSVEPSCYLDSKNKLLQIQQVGMHDVTLISLM